MSISTAINGLFSGFAPHILKAASIYSVDAYDLMKRLGEKGLVGGQEDLIFATASEMSDKAKNINN
jgi:4-hydroxy 2-oxovalerate aldolase